MFDFLLTPASTITRGRFVDERRSPERRCACPVAEIITSA
jgi:hypothetical protein